MVNDEKSWRHNMNLIQRHTDMPDLLNVDRWFDGLFDTNFVGSTAIPAVDVRESEDAYLMEVDLPGRTEKDVEVKLDNNLLTISSKKEEKKEEKKDGFIMRERRSSSFARSFVLPEEVDREKISAEFKNGVLSLSFPKAPTAKPKVIEVKPR
jgi:HSP20 family protein